MGVVLMLKWQLICHQKCVFGLLILYQLSFWYLNSYHAAKRKKLSQIYLPYNQFLLPYKRSIFTIKVAKMIWFLEKSTLYPDLPYKRLPYKWSVLYVHWKIFLKSLDRSTCLASMFTSTNINRVRDDDEGWTVRSSTKFQWKNLCVEYILSWEIKMK